MKNKNKILIKIISIAVIGLMLLMPLSDSHNSNKNINIIMPFTSSTTVTQNFTFDGLPSNQLVVIIYANNSYLNLIPASDGYGLNGNNLFNDETVNSDGSINVPVSMYIGNTSYINSFAGKLDLAYTSLPYLIPENITSDISDRTIGYPSPNMLINSYMQFMFFNVSEYSNIENVIQNGTFNNPHQFINLLAQYENPYINTPLQSNFNSNYLIPINNISPIIYTVTITKIPSGYNITSINNIYSYSYSNGIFKGNMLQGTSGNVTFSNSVNKKTFYFYVTNSNITTNWNSTTYLIPVHITTIINKADLSYVYIIIMLIVMLVMLKYTNYIAMDITGFILFFIGFSLNFTYFNIVSLTVLIFLLSLYSGLRLMGGNK